MRPILVGCLDSKELSSDLYSENLKLGKKVNVWTLKSQLTGLPNNVVGALRATIFGQHVPVVSGGIESRGVETILRRLFGPYGLLQDIVSSRASVFELLRPLTGQHFNVMSEKIREFIGRVNYHQSLHSHNSIYGRVAPSIPGLSSP